MPEIFLALSLFGVEVNGFKKLFNMDISSRDKAAAFYERERRNVTHIMFTAVAGVEGRLFAIWPGLFFENRRNPSKKSINAISN